ncbi:MAG: efflux RND transporter periplasmic adaptor subunit [Nitrospirota bacterium]|nr:efflux RND transporter periplasmic adaptor subunit [Nitrospirota bacterium]
MKVPRRYLLTAVLIIPLAVGSFLLLDRFVRNQRLPEGLIQANGRIEGDHVAVASKFPGRIQQLLVREGATVTVGQVLILLDDRQVRARTDQARHAFEAQEAQVQAAHMTLAVLNLDVPLAIERAEAQVAKAKDEVAKALSVEKEARSDAQRFRELAAKDEASIQQRDQAAMRWEVAQKDIASSRSALTQAVKELAQAELGWKRVRAKESDVTALERQRDQADAFLNEAESVLKDLTITAPTSGTVTTRMVDVGEVVAAGTPLLELVDLDHLYLKVYVPEVLIGKMRLDLAARIYTDAFPGQPFDATVRYIASKAEFTPKEVQTQDERVKLIYAVKLYLAANPDHRLTPGLPADAIIRWREDVAWVKPKY